MADGRISAGFITADDGTDSLRTHGLGKAMVPFCFMTQEGSIRWQWRCWTNATHNRPQISSFCECSLFCGYLSLKAFHGFFLKELLASFPPILFPFISQLRPLVLFTLFAPSFRKHFNCWRRDWMIRNMWCWTIPLVHPFPTCNLFLSSFILPTPLNMTRELLLWTQGW